MAQHLSLPGILESLERHLADGSSGTFLVHSDDRHVTTFVMDKGRIAALFHGPKRGRKALEPISRISGGSCTFQENSRVTMTSQDLPPTHEIVAEIRALSTGMGSSEIPPSLPTGTPARQAPGFAEFSLELKGLLGRRLGPIAGIIFDDACKDVDDRAALAECASALIHRLAEEIGDDQEAHEFRAEATALARRLLGT